MKKKNKTTKEHFDMFKEECKKWQEVFGLHGWEFIFEHKKDTDNLGWFICDIVNRYATIGLTLTWDGELNTEEIKRVAFHEVCEVFLGKIKHLAIARYIRADEIEEEIHQVEKMLEHIIFDNGDYV